LRLVLVCVPLLAAVGLPALADEAPEHGRLAALVRQLDLIDRLAVGAARAASTDRARYRFDYARLREDLTRVRAQPRDLSPLAGQYKTSQAQPSPPEEMK
jgi:RAQPRD family integrative conjugative element protein